MLTLERMREAVEFSGPIALDWTMRDIQDALAQCRAFECAGMSYDKRRESEYHDELAIVAQVRKETAKRRACPCCGRLSP